jgi:hypothetical protein
MSESVRECRDIQKEPDMTPSTPENFWLVDWSLVTIMGNVMPLCVPKTLSVLIRERIA